jgi:NAD-dependent SIR2 family protein deacetylase
MVTNYPQRLTATTHTHDTTATQAGVLNRFASRVGQFLCAMRGHDSVLHFEGKRVMMRCTSCGYDSPGWEVSARAPHQRFEGDRRRHVLVPQRLVLRKSA